MQTQMEESLSVSGVQLSKTLGSGPALSPRFEKTSLELTEQDLQSQMSGRWRIVTMAIIFSAIPAFIYLSAGLPVTGNGMTIGTLVAFTAVQTALFRPVMGLLNVGIQITTTHHDATTGEVRFEHGDLHYPDSHAANALTDIDLTIPAGGRIAVVGSTGSGKSTLATLVSRLYDPTSGRVLIHGSTCAICGSSTSPKRSASSRRKPICCTRRSPRICN